MPEQSWMMILTKDFGTLVKVMKEVADKVKREQEGKDDDCGSEPGEEDFR